MGTCTTLPKQSKSKTTQSTHIYYPNIKSTEPRSIYSSNYGLKWFKTVSLILSFWYRNMNSPSIKLYEDIESIIQQFSKSVVDRFDSGCISKKIKVTNNGLIISNTNENGLGVGSTAFGSCEIGKGEFMIWKCKIKQGDFSISVPYISMGICDNNEVDKIVHNANTGAVIHKIYNSYSLGYDGKIYHKHDKQHCNGKKYCNKNIQFDDIIEIHLNMKDSTLSFRLNNKDLGVAFDKIDDQKKYRLYVLMWYKNQIEILE
eukprot:519998_1